MLTIMIWDLKIEKKTADEVTLLAANACKKYKVAVKCATITANADRKKEYNLSEIYKSPNATIRAILDGTVFRSPILVKGIKPYLRLLKKPIVVARHAYGDIYKNTELSIEKPGKVELVYTDNDGNETRKLIHKFDTSGVVQGIHNLDISIENFAHSCFKYALSIKQDLYFATKDTISKTYDHRFKDIFLDIYNKYYKEDFENMGLTYFYTLIDDMLARLVKTEGGFVLACKNYDGDILSDMLSSAFASLAMMSSVLVSPNGIYEYEAAHGTIQRHFYKYLKGEETSSNSVATIFAWSGALYKRGELDNNNALKAFAKRLEQATIETIEEGKMTKDLASISELAHIQVLNSEDFILAIKDRLININC